jgi:hypothetical protein
MNLLSSAISTFTSRGRAQTSVGGATGLNGDSTNDVVDILNQPKEPSAGSPNKKKRGKDAEQRPVGRPRKRSRTAENEPNSEAEEAAAPAAPGVSGPEGQHEAEATRSGTRLRSRKSSTRQRASTPSMGRSKDVYDLPASPESLSRAHHKGAREDAGGFNLEDSAFEPVPPTKGADAQVQGSPVQNTRSRTERATTSAHGDGSPSAPRGPGRPMRKLRGRHTTTADGGDETAEIPSESRQPARNLRSKPQLVNKDDISTLDNSGMRTANFAYPSPDKTAMAQKKAGKATASSVAAAGNAYGATRREAGRSVGKGAANQNADGESEYVEPADEEGEEDEIDEEEQDQERGSDEDDEGSAHGKQRAVEKPAEAFSSVQVATNGQLAANGARKAIFEAASRLHHCTPEWKIILAASKKNLDKSDPESEPVKELAKAISAFQGHLQQSEYAETDHESSSDSDSLESDLDQIAIQLGNLRDDSSLSKKDKKKLKQDIYVQAIPRSASLLRSILIAGYHDGQCRRRALEDLAMISKALRKLCERVIHIKSTVSLPDGARKRTNTEIKPALRIIEKNYEDAVKELEAAERDASAEREEADLRVEQERLKTQQKAEIEATRRKMDKWMEESKKEVKELAVRPARKDESGRGTLHEVYHIDDLVLSDTGLQPERNDFVREATEDIPGPTKRLWQKEETIALLLLLQKHQGADRYERIHEAIETISLEIRMLGCDAFLEMEDAELFEVNLGSVADRNGELGKMDIPDIRQQAFFLKASQARRMEKDAGEAGSSRRWDFLSSV